jgi:HEPN domain-containing protein
VGLLDNSWGDITALDDYYIPTRYPDALPGSLPGGLPGKEQAEESLQTAKTMFAVAQKRLG